MKEVEKEVVISVDIWGRLCCVVWQLAGPGWLALALPTFVQWIRSPSLVLYCALLTLAVFQISHILLSVFLLSKFNWLNVKYAVNSYHIVEIVTNGPMTEGLWQELQGVCGQPTIRADAIHGAIDLLRVLFGFQKPITLVFSNSKQIRLPRIGPPTMVDLTILLPILAASENTPILERQVKEWIAQTKSK